MSHTLLFVVLHYFFKYEPILPSIFARLLQQDDIDSIEMVDDDKMLLGGFQAQVSGDGGLNDIPIKVATKTVRTFLIACCWGGATLFCLGCMAAVILFSLYCDLTYHNFCCLHCSLSLGSNPSH